MKYVMCLLLISMVLMCGCVTSSDGDGIITTKNIITTITIKELDNTNVVLCGRSSATAYYIIDTSDVIYRLGTVCDYTAESYSVFKSLKVNKTYKISHLPNKINGLYQINGIEGVT